MRGVPGVYRDYSHSSLFRFLSEDVEEGCPTCIVRGLRKPASDDTSDVEGFVGYQAVSGYQVPSPLVVEISALIGCLLVQARNALAGLAAAIRTFLLPGERPLRSAELLLGVPVVVRWLHGLTFGGNEEALEPEVYAYHCTLFGRCGRLPEVTREDNVPLSAAALDGDGLDSPLDRAVQLDLDVADVLNVESPVLFQLATIPVGGNSIVLNLPSSLKRG